VFSDSRVAIVFTRRVMSWVSTMPACAHMELSSALKTCMTGAGAYRGTLDGTPYLGAPRLLLTAVC
jgi:hypothetical protein